MNLRRWILRSLWSGGVSLGIGLLSGLLSVVLGALGDGKGVDAVHGVTLVAFSVFGIALVTLVVILAVNELAREEGNRRNRDGDSSEESL